MESEFNPTPRPKALDEKFCSSCGVAINVLAEICPHCGVRQIAANRISKTALLLLTFFFGGIGAHKFYLGKTLQGIFYLLFCWTCIPGIIAIAEFIIYAIASEDDLNAKYKGAAGGSAGLVVAIIAGIFGGIVLLGILAALAIPRFLGATEKAKVSECRMVLNTIATLEEAHRQEKGRYSTDLGEIGYSESSPRSTRRFEYFVEASDSLDFKVHAKLLTKIGKAEPGDEVVMDKEHNLTATGGLQGYISK